MHNLPDGRAEMSVARDWLGGDSVVAVGNPAVGATQGMTDHVSARLLYVVSARQRREHQHDGKQATRHAW
jgi:hypothetical protein